MKFIYQILFLLCLVSTGFTADTKTAGVTQPIRFSQDVETGSPLSLQHLPTNLRNDAHVFYSKMVKVSSSLRNNLFFQYIKKVVTEDGIGLQLETKVPSYRQKNLKIQQNGPESWAEFTKIAKQVLINDELANNPFSLYFRGFFAYYNYLFPVDKRDLSFLADDDDSKGKEKETKQPHQIRAAQLLNLASKNHYVRATNFMIVKELWDDVELSKSKLERRKNKILAPYKIIKDYVKNHPDSLSTTNQDINKLKRLMLLLPGKYESYQEIYEVWTQKLITYLQASKSLGSSLRLDLPSQTMTVFNALILGTSSGAGLYNWIVNDQTAVGILGLAQASAAITYVLMAGINLSSLRDFCSSISCRNLHGKWGTLMKIQLLSRDIPLNEITFQSRLVVLYLILYNSFESLKLNELLEGIDPTSDRSIALLKKTRKLILSCEPGYNKALSRVIINGNEKEFIY